MVAASSPVATSPPTFWDVLGRRRSVRTYAAQPLADADLQRLIEAATQAPSAGNLQPWFFFVVRSAALRRELASAAAQRFVGLAPAVIVVCADLARAAADYGERGAHLYCLQDTAAAALNLLLAATALGLGACWVGAFDEASVAHSLRLPRNLRPVALVPVGHPRHVPRSPGRRPGGAVSRFID